MNMRNRIVEGTVPRTSDSKADSPRYRDMPWGVKHAA